VKHGRTYSKAKAGRLRGSNVLPAENQVVGKEVNETTQESAEGTVRRGSATETMSDASIHCKCPPVVRTKYFVDAFSDGSMSTSPMFLV
jgi:hypothetical protein